MSTATHSLPAQYSQLEIKSILLLDDDTDLADALKALLESRNFVVTAVSDGVDGLREVMSLDFDVIVCDLMMPHMRGDMFYLAVQKTKPELCDRFIFITGHSNQTPVEDFLKRTNPVVLFKPVLIEELMGMIALVLNKQS